MRNKKSKKTKKYQKFFLGFAVFVFIFIGIILFLTSTRTGLRLISKQFLPDFIAADNIEVGGVDAGLSDQLTFNQVEFKDLKWFPVGTVIRVQRLTIKMTSLNPYDAQIDFENIRLFMPYSGPIVFSGHY